MSRTPEILILAAIVTICGAAPPASAQDAASPAGEQVEPIIEKFHAMTMARVKPGTRLWIVAQGRRAAMEFTTLKALEDSLTVAMKTRFGSSSSYDSAAVAQLVLAEAMRSSESDLMVRTGQARVLTDARARVEDCLNAVRNEIGQSLLMPPSDSCSSEPCRALAAKLPSVKAAVVRAGGGVAIGTTIGTISDLDSVKAQVEAASKRLEARARDEADAFEAAKARRAAMLAAMKEYLAKVSQFDPQF